MPAAMTAEAGMAAIVAAAIVAAAADSGNGDHRDRDRDNGRGGPMIPPGGMVAAEESATVGPSGTSAV